MISTSLAVLALSASSALAPLSNLIHLHPKAPDSRINVALVNRAPGFRDIKVDGHSYTVTPNAVLHITAPAGTRIYVDSSMPFHKVGDVLLELSAANNQKLIDLQ